MKANLDFLKYKAYKLRVESLKATTAAGSGHPTSALSAADMVSALFFYAMHYDPADHANPTNDRFILSKGHAAPVLYAAWKEVGVLTEQELLTLRQFNSRLEGHPTPRFEYAEAATGSLGCGLSIGLGMALSTRVSGHNFYTYVLLGDSEMAEGSVWEAIELAAFYKVHNLVALVDFNRLGQSTETMDDHNIEQHAAKWQAFGWETFIVDGHDMECVTKALDQARAVVGKPTVLVCYTYKGYGITEIQDKEGFHGKAFSPKDLEKYLLELAERFPQEADSFGKYPETIVMPKQEVKKEQPGVMLPQPEYTIGDKIATRKAYGETLVLLGDYSKSIVSLDAEVKNSTFAELFEKKYPERFVQCFIAEQNMIGMAEGFALRGFIPFVSTFASFLTRAHDQIRMASIGRAPLRIAGSHVGVSIGQDGPSQMGLEDMAQMRSIANSVVLYPCDGVSTYKLVHLMANYTQGISYLRMTREETPIIYEQEEEFLIGGCKILRQSSDDQVCIVAAGITLFEALKAYEQLKQENINVSIIDLYSIKPLDTITLKAQAIKAYKRVITVEDHFIQGGLGEAVCYELRSSGCTIEVLAVKELSRSGKPEELLAYHKIDAQAIRETVYTLLK
ncbi:transketolase [Candidatus Dependentiae bacterium]|nr:transketolase [Candidatus Dependentiae bacterium]